MIKVGKRAGSVSAALQQGTLALWLLLGPAALMPAQAAPSIAGAFTLMAHTGATVDTADLAGRPYAIFFGFRQCPVICPSTLAELSVALADLGSAADHLPVLFVTLDPARDTQALLRDYMQAFDPRILALGGSEAEVATTARDFGIRFERVQLTDGSYAYDHSAAVLLVDADGLIVDRLGAGQGTATIVGKLARLLAR